MSAVPDLLKAAHEAGVHLHLDGGKVRMKAEREPPADLVEQLRQHREAVLAFLQDGAGGCVASDTFETPEPAWITAYAERRAIMLEDGKASPAEAHRTAFWEAVGAWEAAHPLTPPAEDCCVVCGKPLPPDPDVVIEVKDGGRVYLAHGLCGQRIHLERRKEARAALAAHGITEKGKA